MSARSAVRVALAVPAIVTGEKSFRKNPAIGSAWLNARGLHRRRVALAAELSARRRRALAPRLDPDEKARFATGTVS